MKFPNWPHNRGGFDGLARSKAQELDKNPIPYLKKHMPNGALAEKKGGFLYVTPALDGLDGFYSLGRIDGITSIVGSPTARGTFTYRGTVPDDLGLEAGSIPQLVVYGRGRGLYLPYIEDSRYDAGENFQDLDCSGWYYQRWLTRTGTALVEQERVKFVAIPGIAIDQSAPIFTTGTVYRDGSEVRFQHAIGTLDLDGLQHIPTLLVDDGKREPTSITASQIAFDIDQLLVLGGLERVGPATYLALVRAYRSPLGSPSVPMSPGYFFCYSTDAGKTWGRMALSDTPIIEEEVQTLVDYPAFSLEFAHNYPLSLSFFYGAPLSATKAIIITTAPSLSENNPSTDLPGRVKLGLFDAETGTITTLAVLYDGPGSHASAHRYIQPGLVPVADGVAIFTSEPVRDDYPVTPVRVRFIDRETLTLVECAPLPVDAYLSGLPSAVDTRTLVCPMYVDGAHRLYQSRFPFAEWTPRAVISSGAPAPTRPYPLDGELVSLQDFGAIAMLRANDLAANSTPGAPWASDARTAAPS